MNRWQEIPEHPVVRWIEATGYPRWMQEKPEGIGRFMQKPVKTGNFRKLPDINGGKERFT